METITTLIRQTKTDKRTINIAFSRSTIIYKWQESCVYDQYNKLEQERWEADKFAFFKFLPMSAFRDCLTRFSHWICFFTNCVFLYFSTFWPLNRLEYNDTVSVGCTIFSWAWSSIRGILLKDAVSYITFLFYTFSKWRGPFFKFFFYFKFLLFCPLLWIVIGLLWKPRGYFSP